MGRRRAEENGAAASGLAALSWPGRCLRTKASRGSGAKRSGPAKPWEDGGAWDWARWQPAWGREQRPLVGDGSYLVFSQGPSAENLCSPGGHSVGWDVTWLWGQGGLWGSVRMASFLLKRVAEWGQVSGGMVTRPPPLAFQQDGGLCGPPASPSHLQPTLPGPCLPPAWMSVEGRTGRERRVQPSQMVRLLGMAF